MSVERDDERAREGVRIHLALIEPNIVAAYLGAAVARIALNAGVTPREAIEAMLEEDTFPADEQWAPKARELKAFTQVVRQRYAGAGIYLTDRDVSSN